MLRYLLLLTLLFFLISGVSAKTCGGDVPCGCGDVLKSSHNMTYDILNCSRGIHVSEGGIVLDCAGHKISGNGSMRGIYIASSGNTFKNCIISGFHTGILLWESSNNTITNNTVESNEYGISLEVLSKNNTIYGNTANKNSFCGIQLRQYSASNRVINNTANSNAMYGIYLQYYSDNSTVIGNTANSNSVHGIYMKYVLSNYIINNTLNSNAKSGLHLLGYSYNRIAGNKANSNSGSGIYMSSATHSSITGNSLNSNGEYGIYIGRDSYNNTLANNTAISNNKGEIYLTPPPAEIVKAGKADKGEKQENLSENESEETGRQEITLDIEGGQSAESHGDDNIPGNFFYYFLIICVVISAFIFVYQLIGRRAKERGE